MARTRSSLALAIPRRSATFSSARMAPRHARAFGRARTYETAPIAPPQGLSNDFRQIVNTFLGGLVFVAVLIA